MGVWVCGCVRAQASSGSGSHPRFRGGVWAPIKQLRPIRDGALLVPPLPPRRQPASAPPGRSTAAFPLQAMAGNVIDGATAGNYDGRSRSQARFVTIRAGARANMIAVEALSAQLLAGARGGGQLRCAVQGVYQHELASHESQHMASTGVMRKEEAIASQFRHGRDLYPDRSGALFFKLALGRR